MVLTRSQCGDQEAEKSVPRRFEEAPRSPSATTSAMREAERTTERREATDTVVSISNMTQRQQYPPAPASIRSTESAAQRIREAELEMEERLLEIRRRELQMEEAMVKKRFAFRIASIQDDPSSTSRVDPNEVRVVDEQITERVDNWLRRSATGAAREARNEEKRPLLEERPVVESMNPRQVTEEIEPTPHRGRQRSPTPTRRNKGIEQLAEAIEKMARNRPPPRQVTDLPVFSGDPREWLPFKAAMEDSTRIYNFSPIENIARLRNSLRGEAREAVAALLHSAVEASTIMKTLEQCFGRPEVLIDRAMEEIKKLPRPGASSTELNSFAVKLQNIVCVLKSIDHRGYLNNPMLARQIMEKLSPHLRARWCDYAEERQGRSEPEIVTLAEFLMREADRSLRHAYAGTAPSTAAARREQYETKAPKRSEHIRKASFATSVTTEERPLCICCGESHHLPKCSKFKEMNTNEKWQAVKGSGLCFKCLEKKHRRFTCRAKNCTIESCQRPHHVLLHPMRPTEEDIEKEKEAVMTAAIVPRKQQDVLLKVCPVTISGPSGQTETYALLDEGSTVTLIDQELADEIGADGPTTKLNLLGVNATTEEANSKVVDLSVKGTTEEAHIIKARTVSGLTLCRQTVPTSILKYPHLRVMKKEDVCYEKARPRLLIGADNWHLIITRRIRRGTKKQPVAAETKLGWVILGTMPRKVIDEAKEAVYHINEGEDLEELVKKHFHIDALGVSLKEKKRPEDERAIRIFNDTARRTKGRFEVGLPWRHDNPTMPPSFERAFQRLKTVEKKMDREKAFADKYTAQISNLLNKGYAEECKGNETENKKAWFLPHFAVRNPNKPEKIRLVFDASAVASSTSLNQQLLEGPDLLQSLPGILFRFREGAVAVTADIEEMFLQIKIRPADQPAQMFLWRGENRTDPPKKYKMTSLIFGASSSPFIAHSVRNRNAQDYAETHPVGYKAITRSHYMDDFVGSFANEEEARNAVEQVDSVHKKAGFKLRGWDSNDRKILNDVPEELRSKLSTHLMMGLDANRTLGLIWDSTKDELGFNTNMSRVHEEVKSLSRPPTKRETLSAVMSIYDPLGFLSPFTIVAKILLQSLWRTNIGWDEEIPSDAAMQFQEWMQGLQNVASLRIPRWYKIEEDDKRRELHIFCDASELAYAAVAYWRITRGDGTIATTLAAAKAKVAPLKTISLPRMELQAAVVGARLASAIKEGHDITSDATVFWTDSKTVLIWIRTNARKYTPFVAHRLGEIAETTSPTQWRWVPTHKNPADDATRTDYQKGPREDWLAGPAFLRAREEDWPQETN